MRRLCTRASCRRLFLVGAAVSVVTLAVSSPIYSAVRGSHVVRHTAASSVVAGGVSLTASRFGTDFAETAPGSVVIARSDGSGSRILASGWSSFVSPDGSRVAVIDSNVVDNQAVNWRLELFASGGGTPTHVIDIDCGPVYWSPDSTKFACVALAGESQKLLVVDAATAARTTLATAFIGGRISFSPDSTRLAFVQYSTADYYSNGGKLKLIDLATRAITTVRSGGAAAPVWGPTAIAFSTVKPRGRNYTYNVAVIHPDGSAFRQLTRFRPDRERSGLVPVAWSANGKRLLGGVIGDDWTAFLAYAIDPIRGGARMITRGVTPSALSRDGRFVIGETGSAATTGLAGSNVVRAPWAAGGKKRVLLRHAVWPSFNG